MIIKKLFKKLKTNNKVAHKSTFNMKKRVIEQYIYDYSNIKYNKEFIEAIKNSEIEVF